MKTFTKSNGCVLIIDDIKDAKMATEHKGKKMVEYKVRNRILERYSGSKSEIWHTGLKPFDTEAEAQSFINAVNQ